MKVLSIEKWLSIHGPLQINNTRNQEIPSQIDTNTEKYEFGCFFHAYTKYHWQPQLVGQEMHSLELANTGGK